MDSCSATVEVVDTTPPILECPADIGIEYGDVYIDDPPTATDNCNVVDLSVDETVFPGCGLTYTVERLWVATDGSGNTAACSQTVMRVDSTPPTIDLNGDAALALECHFDTYVELGAVASDVTSEDLIIVIGGDTVDTTISGTYVVTYDTVDACGNTAEQVTRTISVADTTPSDVVVGPMIELWPPNHEMYTFDLSDCVQSVEDACEGSPSVDTVGTILSIYSDEPEDAKGGGDGDTTDDIVILSESRFQVRAEREGSGNGRVYGVHFEAFDASCNSTVDTCYSGVPHDQTGDSSVNDGAEAGYVVE